MGVLIQNLLFCHRGRGHTRDAEGDIDGLPDGLTEGERDGDRDGEPDGMNWDSGSGSGMERVRHWD